MSDEYITLAYPDTAILNDHPMNLNVLAKPQRHKLPYKLYVAFAPHIKPHTPKFIASQIPNFFILFFFILVFWQLERLCAILKYLLRQSVKVCNHSSF